MYIAKFTFIHSGARYKRGEVMSFDIDSAKDLIKQKLIKPHEVKKKDLNKPFASQAEQALPSTIVGAPKTGKKNRPKLGLSSQPTQAIE